MDDMMMISLYDWFSQWISDIYKIPLSGTPEEVLKKIGAPKRLFSWCEEIENNSYPLKDFGEWPLPDLQRRERGKKRRIGQYYTPENLVKKLYDVTGISLIGSTILDPACGDGAFLIPAAMISAKSSTDAPLENLWGFDLDSEALLVCLARLLKCAPRGGWPNLQKRDFLLTPTDPIFDLVLGNPPYRVNLDLKLREILQDKYETAEGEKDLYTFFLEGGIKALVPGGQLIMLTSHTFLVNQQCNKIRRFLFEKNSPHNLFILPHGFFKSALGVIPVVLHVENSLSRGKPLVVHNQFDEQTGWKIKTTADPDFFLKPTGMRRALTDPKLTEVFQKMEADSLQLGEIAKIGVGIQESLTRGSKISRFVAESKKSSSHVRVVRGREIRPFRISWEGKFLHYGPHLTYAGDPKIFRKDKILYQNIRNESLPLRLVAALDTEGFFPKNSLSFITNPEPPYSLLFIVGLLNSPLINAWFQGNFYSFHITVSQVRKIPIPRGDEHKIRTVENIVNKIISCEIHSRDMLEELAVAVAECFFPAHDVPEIMNLCRQFS